MIIVRYKVQKRLTYNIVCDQVFSTIRGTSNAYPFVHMAGISIKLWSFSILMKPFCSREKFCHSEAISLKFYVSASLRMMLSTHTFE